MNYEDHLKLHRAKTAQVQSATDEVQQRRRIALEECHREAEDIIRGVIAPELQALQAALQKADVPCKITTRRELAPHTPATAFDVEIELLESIKGGRAKLGLRFAAVPADKYFTVSMQVSYNPSDKPLVSELKFSDTTTAAVSAACSGFLSRAFPV